MRKTGLVKLLAVATGLSLTLALAACSDGGDDNKGDTGSSGSPAVSTTSEPSGPGSPSVTPQGGAAPVESVTPGPGPFPTDSEPPGTTVSANGQSVEAGIGTFCWTLLCVDKIGVPTRGVLTVSRGDTVAFAIPDGVPPLREASAAVFAATTAQQLDDGSEIWPYPGAPGEAVSSEVTQDSLEVVVELEPGRYVLSAFMAFESGDVVYGVLLEVR